MIIPAGGCLDEEFAQVTGVKSKALIKFAERTILLRTLEALRGCPLIDRIVVVGTPEVLESEDCELAHGRVAAVGSSPANIAAGLRYLAQLEYEPTHVAIVTADLPFLTPEVISSFLELCDPTKDFNVPLISREDFEERFPGTEATYVRLHDGYWTTGCMYLATVKGISVAMPHLEEVFKNRKSKFKMAKVLGAKFVWDYLAKKLTVYEIERKVMDLLGVKGAAIPGSPAELAMDVDYTEDYQYVVSLMKARDTVSPRGGDTGQ